jgi:phenylacetic acid degradation operon negative regulatory protein
MTRQNSAMTTDGPHAAAVLPEGPSTRVFVLGMQHPDGSLVAAELYDVGATIGFTVHQIRLCLARLVREGAFEQQGRGRKAVFVETERQQLFSSPEPDFLLMSYRQDAGTVRWDGRWHLAGFSIDEERRQVRNELRTVIVALGGALLIGGMYVHTFDWDDLLRSSAVELGVDDRLVLATAERIDVGGITDPVEAMNALWPIEDIADRYRAFVARYESVDHGAGGDVTAALALAVSVSAGFDACIRADPLLPPELLGEDWPGRAARRILLRSARAIGHLRAEAGAPALFSRYDAVFAALDDTSA